MATCSLFTTLSLAEEAKIQPDNRFSRCCENLGEHSKKLSLWQCWTPRNKLTAPVVSHSECNGCCLVLQVNYLLCWSRSSSGTLKEKRLLLFMLRTICFLLLSDVSGTTSSSPSGRSQQSHRHVYMTDYKVLHIHCGGWQWHVKLSAATDAGFIYQNMLYEEQKKGETVTEMSGSYKPFTLWTTEE